MTNQPRPDNQKTTDNNQRQTQADNQSTNQQANHPERNMTAFNPQSVKRKSNNPKMWKEM